MSTLFWQCCSTLTQTSLISWQFHEDAWVRSNGGGGISRVLSGGKVFEKAGVNLSVVYGTMPQEVGRCVIDLGGCSQPMHDQFCYIFQAFFIYDFPWHVFRYDIMGYTSNETRLQHQGPRGTLTLLEPFLY